MASALREAVELEMRLRGFSPRTHESYLHALVELAKFYWRPLETLVCAQVQAFLDHVITRRKLAWATVNVYFSAYRFLYEQVLKRPAREFSIPRRGRSGKRPGVLNRAEVERLIGAPRNLLIPSRRLHNRPSIPHSASPSRRGSVQHILSLMRRIRLFPYPNRVYSPHEG